MTQNGSQNDPKMAPKSLQVGPKIGSQTICLHVNNSSPSFRAQKPLGKPIWDRFGAHLGSIWAPFSMDFEQLWTILASLTRIPESTYFFPFSLNMLTCRTFWGPKARCPEGFAPQRSKEKV